MKPLNSTHVPKSASTASSNRIRAASVYSQVSYVHMSPLQKKLYDDMLSIQQNFINAETILCERANPPYKIFSYRDIYSNHIKKQPHRAPPILVGSLCKMLDYAYIILYCYV